MIVVSTLSILMQIYYVWIILCRRILKQKERKEKKEITFTHKSRPFIQFLVKRCSIFYFCIHESCNLFLCIFFFMNFFFDRLIAIKAFTEAVQKMWGKLCFLHEKNYDKIFNVKNYFSFTFFYYFFFEKKLWDKSYWRIELWSTEPFGSR